MFDIVIIGGGIVGLATGLAVGRRYPRARLLVLEKELAVAAHQTGHNSGVIHSGIYYEPGSLKATLCCEGNRAMVEFCQEHGIAHEVCGKLIVAVEPQEVPRLQSLYARGQANGLEVAMLAAEEAREWEPHVRCVAAVRVPSTGIVDYRQVSLVYADLIRARGGDVQLGTRVERLQSTQDGHLVVTDHGEFQARFVVNCAGLHSDRIARLAGPAPARIIPFRGEYYELKLERRELVRGLIYPVPNPDFPFLGVHLTRMIDGSVHAGPNAVLSLKREGYHKTDMDLRDLYDTLSYPGFWRLAVRNAGEGMREVWRSLSKAAFVRSLQRLVPEIGMDDVIPTHAGVRAQAVAPDGRLVNDFLLLPGDRSLHVCNAPSPAATASLAIGAKIAEQVNCTL
jgi:(S)-2-hydroxyglutarate dehydrogenase